MDNLMVLLLLSILHLSGADSSSAGFMSDFFQRFPTLSGFKTSQGGSYDGFINTLEYMHKKRAIPSIEPVENTLQVEENQDKDELNEKKSKNEKISIKSRVLLPQIVTPTSDLYPVYFEQDRVQLRRTPERINEQETNEQEKENEQETNEQEKENGSDKHLLSYQYRRIPPPHVVESPEIRTIPDNENFELISPGSPGSPVPAVLSTFRTVTMTTISPLYTNVLLVSQSPSIPLSTSRPFYSSISPTLERYLTLNLDKVDNSKTSKAFNFWDWTSQKSFFPEDSEVEFDISPYHWKSLDFFQLSPESQLSKPDTKQIKNFKPEPQNYFENLSEPLYYNNPQLSKKSVKKGIIINEKGSSGEVLKYKYTLLPTAPTTSMTTTSTTTTTTTTTATTTTTTTTTFTTTTTSTTTTTTKPITEAIRKTLLSRKPIKFYEKRIRNSIQIKKESGEPNKSYREENLKTHEFSRRSGTPVQPDLEMGNTNLLEPAKFSGKQSGEPVQFPRSGKHFKNREPQIQPRSRIRKKDVDWLDAHPLNPENEVSEWEGKSGLLDRIEEDDDSEKDDTTLFNPMEITNPFGQTPYDFEDFMPIPKIIPFGLFKNNFFGFPSIKQGVGMDTILQKEKEFKNPGAPRIKNYSEERTGFNKDKLVIRTTQTPSYNREEFVYQSIDDPTESEIHDAPGIQNYNPPPPPREFDSSLSFLSKPSLYLNKFEQDYWKGSSSFGSKPANRFKPSSIRYPPILRSSVKLSSSPEFSIPSSSPKPGTNRTELSTQVEIPPRYLPENKIIKATFFEDMENGISNEEETKSTNPALPLTTSHPQLIRPNPGRPPTSSPINLIRPNPVRSPTTSSTKINHPEPPRYKPRENPRKPKVKVKPKKIKGKPRFSPNIFRPTAPKKTQLVRSVKIPKPVKSPKVSLRRFDEDGKYYEIVDIYENDKNHREEMPVNVTPAVIQTKDEPPKEETIKERLINLIHQSILRPWDSILGDTKSDQVQQLEEGLKEQPTSKPNPSRLQPYPNPFYLNLEKSENNPNQLHRESKSFQDIDSSQLILTTSKPEIQRIPPRSFIKNSKSAPEDKVPPSSQDKYLSFISKYESHQKSQKKQEQS